MFVDGVRVNEAFGDIVNWDLLPQAAIADLTLMPGSNPLFGLNTLGAAIALRTKSGYTHPGGNDRGLWRFVRPRQRPVRGRTRVRRWPACVRGGHLVQREWLARLFAVDRRPVFRQGRQAHAETYDLDLSFTGANTDLVGNGLVPQSLLAQTPTGIFTRPDQTRNQLSMVTLAGNMLLANGSELSGTVYYRRVRTRTLNGDVNDDFEDEVEEGETDVPPAVANQSSTQQYECRRSAAVEHPRPHQPGRRRRKLRRQPQQLPAGQRARNFRPHARRHPDRTTTSSRIRSPAGSATSASTRPTPSPCCRSCSSRSRAATTWPK